MDPLSEFKQRYQQHVETTTTQTPPVVYASKKNVFNKFYVQGLIVGFVIIISSVLIYLNFKPDSKTAITNQQKPVAAIPTSQAAKMAITESQIDDELKRMWGSYYDSAKSDTKLRDEAKKSIMKRFLASQDGLLKSSIASVDNSNYAKISSETDNELEKKYVNSRTIDFVSIYKPPTSKNYEQDKALAVASLEKVREFAAQGKSMKDSYDEAIKTSNFDTTVKFFGNERVTKKSLWIQVFKDAIYSLKEGEVSQVITSPGGSFLVFKVIAVNETQYDTLDDWLSTQK